MNYQLWLPPSEGKTAPASGAPLDLDELVFGPQLRAAREAVLTELEDISSRALASAEDLATAASVLKLGATAAQMLEPNRVLRTAPAAPAHEVYTGVLWEAAHVGDFPTWHDDVIVFSGLFGVVRAGDRIPDHRLSMGVKLPGAGALATYWKKAMLGLLLEGAASEAARPVLDLRSGTYSSACPAPKGSLAVSVLTAEGKTVSHWAKLWRGKLARELMSANVLDIQEIPACAEAMAGISRVSVDWERGSLVLTLQPA